jgi:hypothetical protein
MRDDPATRIGIKAQAQKKTDRERRHGRLPFPTYKFGPTFPDPQVRRLSPEETTEGSHCRSVQHVKLQFNPVQQKAYLRLQAQHQKTDLGGEVKCSRDFNPTFGHVLPSANTRLHAANPKTDRGGGRCVLDVFSALKRRSAIRLQRPHESSKQATETNEDRSTAHTLQRQKPHTNASSPKREKRGHMMG